MKTEKIPSWLLLLFPTFIWWLVWCLNPEPLRWVSTAATLVQLLPMLEWERRTREGSKSQRFFGWYLMFLGANISTTWWVWNSSPVGAVAMLILNSLFMVLPFALARPLSHLIYRKRSEGIDYILLIPILWLLYEFLHHRWDLSWPWLSLGNGWARNSWMAQWYELCGAVGGTSLVWLLNIWLYRGRLAPAATALGGLAALGLLLSFRVDISQGQALNVSVLQPNYDPWDEKFVKTPDVLNEDMALLAESSIDSSSDWLLLPETALTGWIEPRYRETDPQLRFWRSAIQRFGWPADLQILAGAQTVDWYQSAERPLPAARPAGALKDAPKGVVRDWYIPHNSAICFGARDSSQLYHKSKLVPGTEQLPFVRTFPFLESLAISLDENSSTGTLGVNDKALSLGKKHAVAPIICYESIYGDYVREFVKAGATWLAVITNDAWWGETNGHRQHFDFSRTRAIEQRMWVARSANTGISGFIDPLGRVYQASPYNERGAYQYRIYAHEPYTLYYHTGDLFWLMASIVGFAYWAFRQQKQQA